MKGGYLTLNISERSS